MHGSECQGKNMSHLWILSQILFVVFGKWDTVLNCHKQGHSQKVLTNGHELWVSDFCITFTCLQLTSACCSHIMPCWARYPTPPMYKNQDQTLPGFKTHVDKIQLFKQICCGLFAVCNRCLQLTSASCLLAYHARQARGQPANCLHILEYTYDNRP